MNTITPSKYEINAIKEIKKWEEKSSASGLIKYLKNALNFALWPLEKTSDLIQRIPGITWVIQKTFVGILNAINLFAQKSVRQETIINDYQKHNAEINKLEKIINLDLEDVDKQINSLESKYITLAGIEGAATGILGLPGLVLDLLAVISLALRAIGEYATYCSFDTTKPEERLYAMQILGFASSPNDSAKSAALIQLQKLALEITRRTTWKKLNENFIVQIIIKIAKALGVRLTKGKLAQTIPVIGGVVGGGYNMYFMHKVCTAAYYCYRKRFLMEKYGEQIFDPVVENQNPEDAWSDGDEEFLKDIDENTDIGDAPDIKIEIKAPPKD